MYWTGRFLILILATFASCSCLLPSYSTPLFGEKNGVARARKRVAHLQQFQADMFTVPPVLPDLPEIAGSKLLRGCAFRKVEGGPCYSMRFMCDRSPADIGDFYKNVLGSKPWTLNSGATPACLSARDGDKRLCQVSVLGGSCRGKKWQTQYTVNYTVIQPSH